MATKPRQSPMKSLIQESIQELKAGNFPEDPTLENPEEITGPERFEKNQRKKDEVVIDSLLAGIQGKAGYFIKLKKEIRPGEHMLMKTIDNDWRKWPDIEAAIADIVKEHTKVSPTKWGTGTYRMEIACRGGMRGAGYEPRDFPINAEEEFVTLNVNGQPTKVEVQDPAVAVASQIDTLSNLVNMLKGVFPTAPDPGQLQTTIAQAFQQGLQTKREEASGNNAMMNTMITGLIGMMTAMMTGQQNREQPRIVNPEDTMAKMLETLKTFGVLGNNDKHREKSVIEFATELKTLGVDLFKKDDPFEQMNKVKQIANIAADFMGMSDKGERPGIFDKIVDVIGPAIPGIVKDFKDAAASTMKAQEIAGRNISMARGAIPNGTVTQQVEQQEPTTYQRMEGQPVSPSPQQQTTGQNPQQAQVQAFFNNLHESVTTNNRLYYPVVYTSLLQDQKGVELVNGLVSGSHNAQHVIDMLQQYGDARFKDSEFVMKRLVGYVNGFIIWIRQMAGQVQPQPEAAPVQAKQPTGKGFDARCGVCGTVYEFPNEGEWLTEMDKSCEQDGCTGTLEAVMSGKA